MSAFTDSIIQRVKSQVEKSDTPGKAGGLMSGAASKAVVLAESA